MFIIDRQRPATLLARTASLALLVGVLLVTFAGCPSAAQADARNAADQFFEDLLIGGAVGGTIYLEASLKPSLFTKAQTTEERWAVWEAFFKRVAGGTDFSRKGQTPYWGDQVYQIVDPQYVADSASLEVGTFVKVRSPSELVGARVTGYEIHHSEANGSHLLLAIAKPVSGGKIHDTTLLVARGDLPACRHSCKNANASPSAATLGQIRKIMRKGLDPKKKRLAENFVVLQGHFTKRDEIQYVVFYHRYPGSSVYSEDEERLRSWQTVILDDRLSLIAVVRGENVYPQVKPTSVGDINGDGLDEVWADLWNYEGGQQGIAFWRGETKKDSFGWIATRYEGP